MFRKLANTAVTKFGLNKKITRSLLDPLIISEATDGLTLDVGSSNRCPYQKYFPNSETLDIQPGEKVKYVCDAENMRVIPSCHFDCVLFTEVLEHLRHPDLAISEIYRVLKPGGKLILTTRFIFPIHDAKCGDYYRFSRYALCDLLKNFEIERMLADSRPFTTIAILFQRLAFQSEFCGTKFLRIPIMVLAHFIRLFDFTVTKQYSDIQNSQVEDNIMPSGYFVVALKKL
ncbi:class I SAM-dependent methyltransferase [Candidatus Peregrinibacteria bacterium]|nr:class I SAM-dependent methyltransferase [Candidatus Peregrinibacteria bacterium]